MPYGLISPFGSFSGTGSIFSLPITVPAGTAAAPGLNFGSSGLYQVTTNTLGISVAGAALVKIMNTGNNVTFQNTVNTNTTNGFNFYAGSGTLASTLDASGGYVQRTGGIASSPSNNHAAGGFFVFDGGGGHGEFGTIGSASTIAAGSLNGATTNIGTTIIPAGCLVLGVTAYVTVNITGATSVNLGDGTTANAFGTISTLTAGGSSTIANYGTGTSPKFYPSATNVVATAVGGAANFSGGNIRVVVWYITFTAPTS